MILQTGSSQAGTAGNVVHLYLAEYSDLTTPWRISVGHEQTYKFMYFGAPSMSNFRPSFFGRHPLWVPKCVENWLPTPAIRPAVTKLSS